MVPGRVGRLQPERKRGREREDRVAPVAIERTLRAIPGGDVDHAVRVQRRAAGRPHPGVRVRIHPRRAGKGAGEAREAGGKACVDGDEPACSSVDVRSERNVQDGPVEAKVQRSPLRHLARGLELGWAVLVDRADGGVGDLERPPGEDVPAAEVESKHAPASRRVGDVGRDVEPRRRGQGIHSGCAQDTEQHAVRPPRGLAEPSLPEDRSRGHRSLRERIYGVDEVIAGGGDDGAETPACVRPARDGEVIEIQRRGVHVRRVAVAPVERRRVPEFSEVAAGHRRRRQDRLQRIPAGALPVAVEHRLIERRVGPSASRKEEGESCHPAQE